MELFSQNDQDAISTIIAQANALTAEQRQAMLPKVIKSMELSANNSYSACKSHNGQNVSKAATQYAADQLKSLL